MNVLQLHLDFVSPEILNISYESSIFEAPLFLRYNNKMKLFSPIFQIGFKPYFYNEKAAVKNYEDAENDFKLSSDFIFASQLNSSNSLIIWGTAFWVAC